MEMKTCCNTGVSGKPYFWTFWYRLIFLYFYLFEVPVNWRSPFMRYNNSNAEISLTSLGNYSVINGYYRNSFGNLKIYSTMESTPKLFQFRENLLWDICRIGLAKIKADRIVFTKGKRKIWNLRFNNLSNCGDRGLKDLFGKYRWKVS